MSKVDIEYIRQLTAANPIIEEDNGELQNFGYRKLYQCKFCGRIQAHNDHCDNENKVMQSITAGFGEKHPKDQPNMSLLVNASTTTVQITG